MITQEVINHDLALLKERHIRLCKELMYEEGELPPHIQLLGHKKGEPGTMTATIPIPGELTSPDGKEFMEQFFIPQVFRQCAEDGIDILCFVWASEGYIRQVKVEKMDDVPENWRDLPKTEVLMLNFETDKGTDLVLFDVERLGKGINADGRVVDHVQLKERELPEGAQQGEGRFANLFKRFKKPLS
jgi:hypothetical protein